MRGVQLLLLLLACVAASACAPGEPAGPERIVLIVVDTLRADHLGVYGGAPRTPHIDALAARGQVFRDAVSSYYQTSMSMAGLFTGLTPSIETDDPTRPLRWERGNRCGMTRFRSAQDDACVPATVRTIAEDLAAVGYWTVGVTANPLLFRPYGYDQGFDRWIEVGTIPRGALRQMSVREDAESRRGENVNRAVAELLRDRKTDRFFLYVHYLDVHDWLLLDRGYAHSVEIQDTRIGELLDMLAREGLLDGTTIVFTSDHGEALNETHAIPSMPYHFGNPSFEPVIHVPLIVAPPVFDDTEAMVRGTDVRNLIRRIAGEEPLSRLGSLDGLYLSEHRYRTWRDGRYKSVWPRRPGHAPLLFDLVLDPGERLDAAERLPQVLSAHRARIAEASQALATRPVESRDEDSDDDLERLRALGYIE